jgi:hypothetical protein
LPPRTIAAELPALGVVLVLESLLLPLCTKLPRPRRALLALGELLD